MSDLFISHSTKNKELVMHLLELLQTGMRIGNDRIYCTSLSNTLPTGQDFIEQIKTHIQTSTMVIALITPEYLRSHFCMMELGAAWIQSAYLCPILAGNLTEKALDGTPLKSIQVRNLANEDDLYAIYDEMVGKHITLPNSGQFRRKVPEFQQKIATCLHSEKIYPDSEGFYYIKVGEKRSVPSKYRCFKIQGILVLDENETFSGDETHWIFYHADDFPDLEAGGFAKLKISKTERRRFDDLGWVKNIYPSELIPIK